MLCRNAQLTSALIAVLIICANIASAQSTWKGPSGTTGTPTSGNWSASPSNWDTATPSSGSSTVLIFGGNSVYTATNNIGNFNFGTLTLNSSPGGDTIAGMPLLPGNGTIQQNNSGAFTISNQIGITGNSTPTVNLAGNGTGIVTITGQMVDQNGTHDLTVNKFGTSTFVLAPGVASTYHGDTTIFGGVIQANSGAGLSSSSNLTLNGGVLQSNGGVTFSRAVGTGAGSVQWTGSGGFAANGGVMVINLGGTTNAVTWNSTTNFLGTGSALILNSSTADNTVDFQNGLGLTNASRTVTVNDNVNSSNDIGQISGLITSTTSAGALVKDGPGTLKLTNAANSYQGSTTVSNGVLSISAVAANGSNSAIGSGSGVTLGSATTGGTLQYTGADNSTNRAFTVNAGGGTIQSTTNNLTLTGGFTLGANNITFAGAGTTTISTSAIAGTGGTLTKRDAGVLTLSSGVTHTYSGVTNILGGVMAVNGGLSSGGGLVTVGDGTNAGSGTLKGIGNIQRSVTVAKGGSIAPGNSVGILTTNGETWQGGGTYVWEFNDATGTAGGANGFDQLQLNGALAVSANLGNTFKIAIRPLNGTVDGTPANFNPNHSYDWVIATTSSAVTIDPTAFDLVDYVSNQPEGANTATPGFFNIFGSGNNVVLHYSAAPEPGSITLLAIGIGGWLGRRPRRQRVSA